MTLPQIIPRNTLQTIPEIPVLGVSVIIGTTVVVLYTCPAGKKAKITAAAFESNGGGANAIMQARINTNSFHEIPLANQDEPDNVPAMIGQVLEATDTINLLGDNAADNGAAEFNIALQESPA